MDDFVERKKEFLNSVDKCPNIDALTEAETRFIKFLYENTNNIFYRICQFIPGTYATNVRIFKYILDPYRFQAEVILQCIALFTICLQGKNTSPDKSLFSNNDRDMYMHIKMFSFQAYCNDPFFIPDSYKQTCVVYPILQKNYIEKFNATIFNLIEDATVGRVTDFSFYPQEVIVQLLESMADDILDIIVYDYRLLLRLKIKISKNDKSVTKMFESQYNKYIPFWKRPTSKLHQENPVKLPSWNSVKESIKIVFYE